MAICRQFSGRLKVFPTKDFSFPSDHATIQNTVFGQIPLQSKNPMTAPGILGLSFKTWGVVCLGVAILYFFLWPRPKTGTPERSATQHFILRWGHSLVWLLMAAACYVAAGGNPRPARLIGWSAMIAYIVFMATLALESFAAKRSRK